MATTKYIGYAVSIISAAVAVSTYLSPERYDDIRMSFLAYIFNYLFLDFIIISIIGLILIFAGDIAGLARRHFIEQIPIPNKQYNNNDGFLFVSQRSMMSKKTNVLFIASTSITFLIVALILSYAVGEIFAAANSRAYYYVNIYDSYRRDLYRKANEYEWSGDYALARRVYLKIIELFPNDYRNNYISRRVYILDGLLNHAKLSFEKSERLYSRFGFEREGFIRKIEAFRTDPNNELFRSTATHAIKKIESDIEFAVDAVKKDCDKADLLVVAATVRAHANIFFEREVWSGISKYFTTKELGQIGCDMFARPSAKEALRKSWQLEKANDVADHFSPENIRIIVINNRFSRDGRNKYDASVYSGQKLWMLPDSVARYIELRFGYSSSVDADE